MALPPQFQHVIRWLRRASPVGLVALALVACLVSVRLWRAASPPLPATLSIRLSVWKASPGLAEPILVTGKTGAGDFLAIRYTSKKTAQFLYDCWGAGGPMSEEFELPANSPLFLEISTAPLPNSPSHRLLTLRCNGTQLLQREVGVHGHSPQDVHFGVNRIGGSTTERKFAGAIETVDGRILERGGDYFSAGTRLRYMLTHNLAQVLGWASLLPLSYLVAAAAAPRLAKLRVFVARESTPPPQRPKPHAAAFAAIAVCTGAFAWFATCGTFDIAAEESFGTFYDFQAASLIEGRLDVPATALSGEAFAYRGKTYGYFGPTPALLRMPFALLHVGFGKLSRGFVIAFYALSLAGAYACVFRLSASAYKRHPSRAGIFLFLLVSGLGSTLFFLGARAYVYHEAILCGIMFAIWAGHFCIRYIETRSRADVLAALALGIAAVHARPPVGLFALGFLGAAALVHVVLGLKEECRLHLRPLAVILCACAGVLSFNVLSYLKFETFEGCPLRYNIQYDSARLARIDSRQFHASNLAFGASAYLTGSVPEFSAGFPFVRFGGSPVEDHPEAKLDMVEPLVSIPWSMTGLVCLMLFSPLASSSLCRRTMCSATLAVVVVAGAIFTAIAVSHRYTGDFVPFMLLAGAVGFVWLDHLRQPLRGLLAACLILVGAFSAWTTIALTAQYQAEIVWGVPKAVQERYHHFVKTVDGLIHDEIPAGK